MMSPSNAFEHAFELALQKVPDADAQSSPPGMVFHPASAIDEKRCWATNTVDFSVCAGVCIQARPRRPGATAAHP